MTVAAEDRRDDDVIDVRALLSKLLVRRWWIVISVATFTIIFSAIAFLMTPVYRASTILVPASEERGSGALGAALGQLGGIASLAGLNIGTQGASETEEALAVLHSRHFTESFIHDHNLIPKLFPSKWDSARNAWKVGESGRPTPGKAYKYFDRKIRTVQSDKKTGLVTLQIDWTDRNEAAAWANELVQRLNREMRARAMAKADASVGFLEKESKTTTTVAARDAVGRLMEVQIKQRMLANVTEEYAFRVVDKAMPPDKDDPVKPQKLVLIIAGVLIGIAVGVGLALISKEPVQTA